MGPDLSSSLSIVNSAALRHGLCAALCNAAMRTVEEVRRLRLAELREEAGSWAEINRRLGLLPTDSTFSQVMSHKTKKDMGSAQARRLEQAFGRDVGWMDTDPDIARAMWPFERVPPEAVAGLDQASRDQLEAVLVAFLAAVNHASAPVNSKRQPMAA